MQSWWTASTAVMSLVLFQNCSPGFLASDFSNVTSASVALTDVDEGKALYAQNCASCHGDVASSAKRGRSSDQISLALTGVSQMTAIKLSLGEIDKITSALSLAQVPAGAQFQFTCTDSLKRGATNPAVSRMTSTEIRNTLQVVLGSTLITDNKIQDSLDDLPSDDLIVNVREYDADIPHSDATVLLAVADRTIELTDASAALKTQFFGACSLATPVTDACVQAAVTNFGQTVFRRPLESTESDTYVALAKAQGGGLKGLESVLFVLLQTPSMSMHIEFGASDTGLRTRLTDFEIANRISYLTLAAPPDAALMTAAKAGELQDIGQVKKHVTRLLDQSSSIAQQRLSTFFKFYSGLGQLPDPNANAAKARGIASVDGLGFQMTTELDEYSRGIFWKATGNFEDLMTSHDAYPRSETLRKIVGASKIVGNDGAPVQAAYATFGFLHRPALLLNDGPRTNPVLRGAHLRQRYLCDPIPEPPSDLVAQTIKDAGDIEAQSNRSKYEQLTSSVNCTGCHNQINPVGMPFESYDQLGMARTTETLYNDDGSVKTTYALNTKVVNPQLETNEQSGTQLDDSIQMATAIGRGSKGRSCFVQKTFEFLHNRTVASTDDGCGLREAENVSQTGTLRDVFIKSIANEDIFWRQLQP